MTASHALLAITAGVIAGALNTVVGSGTLVTFPALLALGYPPVTANTSNTLGLIPGSLSGAYGYRRELTGQAPRLRPLGAASLAGGLLGAVLLLALPPRAFAILVPALIAAALILVMLQPRLTRRVTTRRPAQQHRAGAGALLAVAGCGVYGGYFGAAQGVLLIITLALALGDDLQRLNAIKNVLVGLVNLAAAVVFVIAAPIAWPAVACIAAGSLAGGRIGAHYGRRLSPPILRAAITLVGLAAIGNQLLR